MCLYSLYILCSKKPGANKRRKKTKQIANETSESLFGALDPSQAGESMAISC